MKPPPCWYTCCYTPRLSLKQYKHVTEHNTLNIQSFWSQWGLVDVVRVQGVMGGGGIQWDSCHVKTLTLQEKLHTELILDQLMFSACGIARWRPMFIYSSADRGQLGSGAAGGVWWSWSETLCSVWIFFTFTWFLGSSENSSNLQSVQIKMLTRTLRVKVKLNFIALFIAPDSEPPSGLTPEQVEQIQI